MQLDLPCTSQEKHILSQVHPETIFGNEAIISLIQSSN